MESFDPRDNFWEVHPELTSAGAFAPMYKKDKTKGKIRSSKIAWCIKLIWDRGSKFYNLPEVGPDNKIDMVFTDILGEKKFYKENEQFVEELREFYIRLNDSVAKRTLRGIEDKLIERDKFLRATPYPVLEEQDVVDVSEWAKKVDVLDKMLANTKKLYDLYDDARKIVEQEQQQSTRGDEQESLSDSGEI